MVFFEKEIIKLQIKTLVYRGYGLGFKQGLAIFVEYSVPGDIVDVEIITKKKGYLRARIKRFHKRSSQRIKPKCKLFGRCGGCDWQFMPYETQLLYKQEIITDFMNKLKGFQYNININKIVKADNTFFYRNKVILPVGKDDNEISIGFYKKGTHKIIPQVKCYLQPDIVNSIIQDIRIYCQIANISIYNENNRKGNLRYIGFRLGMKLNEIVLFLVTTLKKLPQITHLYELLIQKYPSIVGIVQNINTQEGNYVLGKSEKIHFGRSYIYEQIGNKKFKIDYKSFFQINTEQTEKLYNIVANILHKEHSKLVIDAYCGTGSIGMYCADIVDQIIGIENNPQSIIDGNENLYLNNVHNYRFILGKIKDQIGTVLSDKSVDTIIFDPPRIGIDKEVIHYVAQRKIKNIIYISCDPATQIRDLNILLKFGYKIENVYPIDMFPQTYHIENVVHIKKC